MLWRVLGVIHPDADKAASSSGDLTCEAYFHTIIIPKAHKVWILLARYDLKVFLINDVKKC